MNALAHAIAHAQATATRATSDDAKTREGKGREGTTPHHKAFGRGEVPRPTLTQLRPAAKHSPSMVLPVIGLGAPA